MTGTTFGRLKDEVAENPATDRLKDELRHYLHARARHTVTRVGARLGERVAQVGEGGGGSGSTPTRTLTRVGKALGTGKSPAKAALSAGASQLKDTVGDRVKGLLGKGGGGRTPSGGAGKSVTVVEDIDVGVPVREAYDQWTQFQEFSRFAKGVVSVETTDDTNSNWTVKVGGATRSWRANITEQIPDERIAWTTHGAKGTVRGVVTFHPLTDDLTRVLLVLEYRPKGLVEKTGNIWRAQGRRARLDLKLYRKFLMMRDEATDAWRGEIRDGEVVVDHEQAVADEEAAEESTEEPAEDADHEEDAAEEEDEEGVDEDAEGTVDSEDSEDEEEPADEGPGDERPIDDR